VVNNIKQANKSVKLRLNDILALRDMKQTWHLFEYELDNIEVYKINIDEYPEYLI